jgi:hypothetical protein
MAESTTLSRKRRDELELDLLREVQRAGAEFNGSLNGNREAARRGFEKALRIFTNFILKRSTAQS